MTERAPVLVLCAHGTRDLAGAAVVRRIARRVNHVRPQLEIIRGYVDVQSPHIGDLTAALFATGRRFVVVPLLLSAGHHVLVDLPQALNRPGSGEATGPSAGPDRQQALGAAPLGPDPALAEVLVTRLREAGARDDDAVVLAAAGSTRAEAAVDAYAAARMLRERWAGPVRVGYGASASPTVAEAVARLRTAHRRVAVASYLIGPGHFHSRLKTCGADVVSAPLGAHESVVRLVLDRYDEARSRTAELSSPVTATATSARISA